MTVLTPPITGDDDLDSYLYNVAISLSEQTTTPPYVLPDGVTQTDTTTGIIADGYGNVVGYLYRYLAIKYADNNVGLNFSNNPTGRLYYGLRNTDVTTESTNPTDYTWYLADGGGFGTTRFLFYKNTGGRTIQFNINTAPIDYKWLLDNGSVIDLDNLVPASTISNTEILNNAITELKIAANAVTAAKTNIAAINPLNGQLAADIVNATNILDGAVGTTKIANDAITTPKILAGSITGIKIAADSIDANKIQANAVTADKILANAVVADKIAADAVTSDKIVANAVTAVKILAGTITGDKIAANTVTADKIDSRSLSIKDAAGNIILAAGNPLDWSTYVGGAGKPADNATVGATIGTNLSGQITSANASTYIANAAIGSAQIGDASITTAKILDASITTAKIQDLAVSTLKIADQAVTIPVGAYTNGNILPGGFNNNVSVQTLTYTSSGSPVIVSFGVEFSLAGVEGVFSNVYLNLYRIQMLFPRPSLTIACQFWNYNQIIPFWIYLNFNNLKC